jgi:hypothetical protein
MTKLPEGDVRLNINIEKDLHYRFKVAAALQGKRMTDIVVELIQNYVDQQNPPSRLSRKGRK